LNTDGRNLPAQIAVDAGIVDEEVTGDILEIRSAGISP